MKMVEVKLQTRISKQGKNNYKTYVITLPKIIVEMMPKLRKTKKFEINLKGDNIVLSPK